MASFWSRRGCTRARSEILEDGRLKRYLPWTLGECHGTVKHRLQCWQHKMGMREIFFMRRNLARSVSIIYENRSWDAIGVCSKSQNAFQSSSHYSSSFKRNQSEQSLRCYPSSSQSSPPRFQTHGPKAVSAFHSCDSSSIPDDDADHDLQSPILRRKGAKTSCSSR